MCTRLTDKTCQGDNHVYGLSDQEDLKTASGKTGYFDTVRMKLLGIVRIIFTLITNNAIVALIFGVMWCIPGVMTLRADEHDAHERAGAREAPCDGLAWGFACVILVMGLIIMSLTIKWCRARRYRTHDGLYLQISVDDMTETLHLGECLMPMDHLYQEDSRQPLIKNITVTSGWGGHTAELLGAYYICYQDR